jgi:hypothetical protein
MVVRILIAPHRTTALTLLYGGPEGRSVGCRKAGRTLNAVMSSLAAFLAAGVRPPTPLAKAIMLVLTLKLLAIAAASIFLFSINERPTVDSSAVSQLIGPSTPLSNEGRR